MLLLPFPTVVQSRQTGTQQGEGRGFGGCCRRSRERESDTIVPEVTIGIEAKCEVASVQEVRTQNLKLIRREGVDEIRRRRAERPLRQKGISGTGSYQRIAEIAGAREIVMDISHWGLS